MVPSARAASVTKSDAPSGGVYLDATTATRSFTLVAGDLPVAQYVNLVTFTIDFEKYDGETMGVNAGGTPYYNEIVLKLKNPAGIETTLISSGAFTNGAGGFRGTITFDDRAAQVVNVNTAQPSAGTFKPTGPNTMSSLNTASWQGIWTLTLQDTVAQDHLGYWSSSLSLTSVSIPEPTTALFVLAGLGLGVLRRRRRV